MPSFIYSLENPTEISIVLIYPDTFDEYPSRAQVYNQDIRLTVNISASPASPVTNDVVSSHSDSTERCLRAHRQGKKARDCGK